MTPEDVPDRPLVVDTDVASFAFLGKGRAERFKPLLDGHVLCLSFATVGELWTMAEHAKAKWGERRRADLEAFIRRFVVLPVDAEVTAWYARIHAAVSGQVDQNDEWTAACALAQNEALPVVTNNVKHFERIAGSFGDLIVVHPDK